MILLSLFLQCAKLVARVKFVFPRVINYKRRGREGSGLTIKSCKLVQTHAAGPCTDHFASPLRPILNLLTYPGTPRCTLAPRT